MLLSDPELASWALIALEAIPDPACDAALRDALGKVKGRLLIGVINSIGVRRDAGAVEPLAALVGDADADVASVAAVALGSIGTEAAAKILEPKLADSPAGVRSGVAEGCVLCARTLLAGGKTAEATALYDKIRTADVPKQRVIEATRGAILARKAEGVPLLVEQLRSPDKRMYRLGLTVARELDVPEVSVALVAELGTAPPDRAAMILVALADRGDRSVLPAVRKAAKSGPKEVRVEAVGVLEQLGNVSCVPELLDIAAEDDAELADAAKAVLSAMPGDDVNADLVGRLAQAKDKARLVAIEIVGQRRLVASVPALLKAADDADAAVRAAALLALGSAVGQDNLSVLIERVAKPGRAEDTKVAEKALLTACVRMPDREACAGQLVAAMAGAPGSAKCTLLEVLGEMGGAKALEAMGTAAKEGDDDMKDTASRLLGKWMELDAAPVILDLAKTLPEAKYKIRVLRGYISLVRRFDMPDAERARMCRVAIEAADRAAEKQLVLEVMVLHPSVDMLQAAFDAAKEPELKKDATRTALTIAGKLPLLQTTASPADVQKLIQKLMKQLGQPPVKVEIVKAEYGAGDKVQDVTEIVRKAAGQMPLVVLGSPNYNEAFGGDPAPNVPKQLKIQYKIDGKPGEVTLPENATILLPMPK
ncbi:MAG: hypothetical protein NTW96_01150 [Planctomycetia bacterium]|nr:hypothetical protein [Planctomycetia bacterium]